MTMNDLENYKMSLRNAGILFKESTDDGATLIETELEITLGADSARMGTLRTIFGFGGRMYGQQVIVESPLTK